MSSKNIILILVLSFCVIGSTDAQKRKKGKKKAKSAAVEAVKPALDSVAYSFGVMIGQNFKQDGIKDLDARSLAKGIRDVLNNNNLQISENEAVNLANQFRKEQKQKIAMENLEKGKAFLAANAKKDGVVTLPSGLQYKIVKEGNGPIPTAADKVKTHYHGMLIDGTVFDSSVDRGEPITFPVGGVIKGWQEALQLMPVGSKWQVYIPSDLAYGTRGAGEAIKPNATLIFDVELLNIEK